MSSGPDHQEITEFGDLPDREGGWNVFHKHGWHWVHTVPNGDSVVHRSTIRCLCGVRKERAYDGPHMIGLQFIHNRVSPEEGTHGHQ